MAWWMAIPAAMQGIETLQNANKRKEVPMIGDRRQMLAPSQQGNNTGAMMSAGSNLMGAASSMQGSASVAPSDSIGASGSGSGAGSLMQGIESQGPMQRRLSQIEESPEFKLNMASAALDTASPALKQEYGPTILEARRRLSQQNRRQ